MIPRIVILSGRFAPFCNAHLEQLRQAFEEGEKVVVVVSDADLSRSSRLPWTAEERETMCRTALVEFGDQIRFIQIDAMPHDKFGLAGFACPETKTPVWSGVISLYDARLPEEAVALAAFYDGDDAALRTAVPAAALESVTALRQSPLFPGLAEEHRYLQGYKASWAVAPCPVVLVSVDVLIVHSGELLLIERGRVPGKGLWALPGGFVEPDESLIDAALRELREETGLQLNPLQTQSRLKASHVFDDPWRSGRGRVITHAFHFELDGIDQPRVSGQDDAAAAHWVPLKDLKAMRGRFFDDHSRIISHFLRI